MADNDDAEKTEEPTQKKRDDAFAEGQFARAAEIGVVCVLLGAFMALSSGLKDRVIQLANVSVGVFSNLSSIDITDQRVISLLSDGIQSGFYLISPMLIMCFVGAVIGGGIQTGFRLTTAVLGFKWGKANPMAGFQRLFSKQSWIALGLDLIKFGAVGGVLYGVIKRLMGDAIFFSTIPLSHLTEFILDSFLSLMTQLIIILGLIAVVHYMYQRFKVTQDLRMTKQEIKDEQRQSMGDPIVRAAQRRMAFQLMQRQMLDKVPTADVIVTNPTHYAIAMKYERGIDKAPIVLAKGKNLFAKKIKEIAYKHSVPVTENKIVARVLYKIGKVGNPIPVELYQVVAEILSYVYKTHKYYFHKLKERRQELEKK